LQKFEIIRYKLDYLYRWHSMVPEDITIGKVVYDYSKILFKPNILTENGLLQTFSDLTSTNIGRVGLNNTPDFLLKIDVATLLHSRVLKTQSYTKYKEYFEGTIIKDFSEITKVNSN
jgi:prostaglandin-endoperoxide synthase 2